jgi:hypothetical protein
MGACPACSYFRKAKPADPFAGWRVLSPKIFELRSRWEKHLDERAMWEQQRFESWLPFDFEPLFYPYCQHFTDQNGKGPNGQPLQYELCSKRNPRADCKDFDAKKEPTT